MVKTPDESNVGIAYYVSNFPGFRGVLRQRYSDFIVNEGDSDGNVVLLASFDLPPECPEEKEEEKQPSGDNSYNNEVESFRALSGEKNAEMLKGLLEIRCTVKTEDVEIDLQKDPSLVSMNAELEC